MMMLVSEMMLLMIKGVGEVMIFSAFSTQLHTTFHTILSIHTSHYVNKMMLVMIIIVPKMMVVVMIKGVGECRLVAKSKHRPPCFDNFDKPDYPLFVHNVDPGLYQFELLEFYLRLSGHLAYLRKDERAV